MRVSFDSRKLLASVWIGIAAEAARRAGLYETHSQRLPADEHAPVRVIGARYRSRWATESTSVSR